MSVMRGVACVLLALGCPVTAWAGGTTCTVDISSASAARSSWISPLAVELTPTVTQLGGASGVLAQSYDEALSVESVLTRIKIDGCRQVASITPAASPAAVAADPATYKPQTAFDNTPWRFNMTQNGKRMTADEFDAWMKSRGVRVVPSRPATQEASATPAATGTSGN